MSDRAATPPASSAPATATATIELWYELASTYSYLAVARAPAMAAAAGVALVWRPFLLGPIFARQGWNDSPFNLYPAKGDYMWRDLERSCQRLGLPYRRPSQFPRHSVLAARIAVLPEAERDGWRGDFSRRVLTASFGDDLDIAQPAVLIAILDAMGLPGADLCERARHDDNKLRLRAATDEATARGIFGAPTFAVGRELFWGNDRLEEALAWTTEARAALPSTQ